MSGERIETAGEYTPTTEDVEVYFALGLVECSPGNGHALDVAHDGFRRWLSQVTTEAETRGAVRALLGAAEALDTAQVWWGDYRDSDGHQRYGACLHEVIDPDSRPYPTTRFVGLTDWLRARAEQIGDDRA